MWFKFFFCCVATENSEKAKGLQQLRVVSRDFFQENCTNILIHIFPETFFFFFSTGVFYIRRGHACQQQDNNL